MTIVKSGRRAIPVTFICRDELCGCVWETCPLSNGATVDVRNETFWSSCPECRANMKGKLGTFNESTP